jgi:hypothetical protein
MAEWNFAWLDGDQAEAHQALDGHRDDEELGAGDLSQPPVVERHGVAALGAMPPVAGHGVQHLALDVGQAGHGGRLPVPRLEPAS